MGLKGKITSTANKASKGVTSFAKKANKANPVRGYVKTTSALKRGKK
jgi:hypothetical protein